MEDVNAGQWKYTDGKSWNLDSEITINCLDKTAAEVNCLYSDQTDFQGGDLPDVFGGGGVETNPRSSAECINLCERTAGCNYWTWVMDEKINCFLKRNKGESVRRPKHVSGSDPRACSVTPPITTSTAKAVEVISNEIEAVEPAYNENEINGKFKIMMAWNDNFNDPESKEYQSLTNDIENGLEDMLRNERGLSDQVEEFTVKVQKLRRGSVVCDFKVNYILKEAYIAIPFAIKPANITDAMSNNFKFKKGILFQRFLIAGGSFNASSPVDHCAAKGCSHKCNYDYSIEDYVCTCPPDLVLGSDGLNCITEGEEEVTELYDGPREEASITTQTTLVLLPTNCLWGTWSDWGQCSVTCGKGRRQRSRSVLIPEKNGGECNGDSEEFVDCNFPCEDGTKQTTEAAEEAVTEESQDTEQRMSEETETTTAETSSEDADEDDEEIQDDDIDDDYEDEEEEEGDSEEDGVEDDEEDEEEEDVNVVYPDDNTTDSDTTEKDMDTTTLKIMDDSTTQTQITSKDEVTEVPVSDVTNGDKAEMTTESVTDAVTALIDDVEDADFGAKIDESTRDDVTTEKMTMDETTKMEKDIMIPQTETPESATVEVVSMEDVMTTTIKDMETTTQAAAGDMSSESVSETSTAGAAEVDITTENAVESSSEKSEEVTTQTTAVTDDSSVADETTAQTRIIDDTPMSEKEESVTEETDEVVSTTTEGSAEGMVEVTTAKGEMMSPENGTICNPLEEIANSDPCKLCQCTDGVMVCAQEDCSLPEPYNQSCKPLPIEAGKCCPKYECEIPDEIQEDDASGDVDSEASGAEASGADDSEASGADEDEASGDANTTTEKTPDTLPSNSDDAVTDLNADETTTKAMEDDMKMEATTKMIDDVPSSTEAESDAAKDAVTTESEDEVNTTTPQAMDDSEALPSVVTEKVQEEEEDANATEGAIMDTTTKSDTSDAAVTESDATADTTVAGMDKTDDSMMEDDTEGAMMTKGPRMDTSSETEAETTTATIIEVPAATSEASIDSDSLVTEGVPEETTTALPVTVIGVQEDDDTVTIVTMKPTTEDDMSGDGEGSTTTMQSIIDDETATTTVAADTTTTAPTAAADQEFLCTHTQNDTDTSGDLPMNCTQMEGEEKKTVMLLIPKEVLGDISLTRLFDKNVKIVVKDFMVMDRSPRRL